MIMRIIISLLIIIKHWYKLASPTSQGHSHPSFDDYNDCNDDNNIDSNDDDHDEDFCLDDSDDDDGHDDFGDDLYLGKHYTE